MESLKQRAEQCRSSIDINVFKGYDIRGDAQITEQSPKINLREEDAYLIGQAIGSTYTQKQQTARILITADHRPSSEMLRAALAEGFASSGCQVWVNQEATPTGATSWAILEKRDQFDVSVQITGSHNPYYNNGFKITCKQNDSQESDTQGLPQALYGDRLKKIHHKIVADDVCKTDTGNVQEYHGLVAEYQKALTAHFQKALGGNFRHQFRVVLDAGNGLGCKALEVLRDLDVEVEEMFTELLGTFPNHPADPSKVEGVEMAQEKVRALNNNLSPDQRPWLALVFDGDGDRCGIIGEDGNVIYPEQIVAILYTRFLLQNKEGFQVLGKLGEEVGLALDVRGTGVIEEVVAKYAQQGYGIHGDYITCGYPNHRTYVRQQIDKINTILERDLSETEAKALRQISQQYTSAESSGHFFYSVCEDLPQIVVDDGIFSALKLLEILDTIEQYEVAAGIVGSKEQYQLNDIFQAISWKPSSNEVRGGSPYEDAEKDRIIGEIAATISQERTNPSGKFPQKIAQVIDVDGVRVVFDDGSFFVIRASQTSPKFTYKFEANTRDRLYEVMENTMDLLRPYQERQISLTELEKELALQKNMH